MSDPIHIVCPHCDAVNRIAAARLADRPVCGKCARELFMAKPLDVDSARFMRHIERNDIPVLVDFWAAWCGPCRMIAPVLDQLAADYAGRVKVAKLDVDANQQTAMRFQVRSIPMLLFFKDGQVVDQLVGALPRQAIESKFVQHAG